MIYTKSNGREKEFNWTVLLIVSLSSIVTGIYRDGFAALFPFIQQDFQLSRAQLGLHSTLFFFAIAFSAIFAGRLVDIKGTRWGMVTGLSLMGVLITLHSIVPNFFLLLILAAFTGVSVSMNLPSASKGIVEWFPKKWRSSALGFRSTAFPFGGMIGSMLLPFIAHMAGWQKTILFPGLLSLICAILIYIVYHDKDQEFYKSKESSKKKYLFWKTISQLVKNKDLMSVFIFGIFLAATNAAIVAHFTLYLYLDYDLSESLAGLGFAFVQLGSMLGRLGWGYVCDNLLETDKRKTFLYLGVSFSLIIFIIVFLLEDAYIPIGILMLLAFLIGWSGRGWQGIYVAYVAEAVEDENIGTAVGFSSLFTRPSMMLTPPIFGYIADITGSYNISWLILGILLLIASVAQYIYYLRLSKNS